MTDFQAPEGKPNKLARARYLSYLIIPIMLIGIYLRHFAFFLPANNGDPIVYQSLAMKMNHGFMQEYDIFKFRSKIRGNSGLVDYVWEENPDMTNARRTRKIYHLPLHIQPPLFPILIWVSHGLFKHGGEYTSIAGNLGESIRSHPPWKLAKEQAYAILPPFLCSTGLILLVYFFCAHFFSAKEGLIAAAIIATSPLDIAVGAKIYADGPLSFFTFSAVFLYFYSLDAADRKAWGWAALAGLTLGLAYLTKVSGILFAFSFILASILHPRSGHRGIICPQLWIAGAFALLTASPWLSLMYHHYQRFSLPTPADSNNSWYNYIFGRPLKAYPLDLLWFAPPLILGGLTGLAALRAPRRYWKEYTLFAMAIFYIGMFMIFAQNGTAGIEDRYLLPIYPLLAVLTGIGAVQAIERVPKCGARRVAYGVFTLALIALTWRSARIGLGYSFKSFVVFNPLGY
jgi:hypothetical protein